MIIQKWFQPIVLSVIALKREEYICYSYVNVDCKDSRLWKEVHTYILLPFEQLKKQYTKGGTKKMFSKIWLIITATRQQSDCFSHNNGFCLWFWQQSIYKKTKKSFLFYSVLQNTMYQCNEYFKRLKSLIVSITYKEMQVWKIQTNNIQTDVLSCFAKDFRHRWR